MRKIVTCKYKPGDLRKLWGEVPDSVANREESGEAFSYYVDGELVASAGIARYWDGVGEVWLAFGEKWHLYKKEAVIHTGRELDRWMKELGYRRLFAFVELWNETAVRFAEHYGFVREGVLEKHSLYGYDVAVYGRLK